MTTRQRIASAVGVIVFFVAVMTALSFCRRPSPQVAFSCVGVSASSNGTLVSIAVSNQSTSDIVYYIGDPVWKSAGMWRAFQYPAGTTLQRLAAGQSVTGVVTALSASAEARVPVLWGFTYSPRATRWQELREDVAAYLRMHDFRGRGALYTNLVTNIKL